jgi:hypothetical protein
MEDMVSRSIRQHDGYSYPSAALPENTMDQAVVPG